jgi:hypothetical protein
MKYLFIALVGYLLISHVDRALSRKPSRGVVLPTASAVDWTSPIVAPPSGQGDIPVAAHIGGDVNIADIKRCCERIIKDYQRVFFLQDRNGKMKLQIRGIYAHGAALFFLMRLNNRSPLDYDVDSIRFFIAASSKGKSPPRGTKMLAPVYVYDSTAAVPGYTRATSIFVLPRFTLPSGRQLFIDVQEKNGGRHLQVQASNLSLVRARLI